MHLDFVKTIMIIRLTILLIIIKITSSARILGVFPAPSFSHQVVFRALCLELNKRGHDITIVTPNPIDDPPENYEQIDVSKALMEVRGYLPRNAFNMVETALSKKSQFEFMKGMSSITHIMLNAQMKQPNVTDLFKRRDEFDLLMVEIMDQPMYGFAHVINAPFIGISSASVLDFNLMSLGSPTHPFLYPQMTTAKITDLTLWDKIYNLYESYKVNDIWRIKPDSDVMKAMKLWFGEDCPTPEEIEKNNVDLFLTNSYPLLSGIRPTVPAVVNVGGLHVNPKKPLPKDLEDYLDKSKQGVIYFSLGSNVLSKQLPKYIMDIILDVFSQLPYNVLWKFETDDLPGKPSNVKIEKWLPQNDLLGHPNVKLFITQGGLQSMDEGIQNGVPFLVIPFIGDQQFNAQRIETLKMGLCIDLAEISKEELKQKITTVAENPSFKSNVLNVRELINDEPMSSMDKAVWWVEYVIRHKGAKHLRSPSADATWIEFFMIDVLSLVLLGVFTILLIVGSLIRWMWMVTRLKMKHKKA